MRTATFLKVVAAILGAASPVLAGQATGGLCTADATRLCFHDGRFSAELAYLGSAGPAAAFAVRPGGTLPGGYFHFGDREQTEMWLDMPLGCAVNANIWLKVLAVADEGWTLTVRDFASGAQRTYSAAPGELPPPIVDIEAFPCTEAGGPPAPGVPPGPSGLPQDFIGNGRFIVGARESPSSFATAARLTRNSALLSFTGASAPDLLVVVFSNSGSSEFLGVAAAVSHGGLTLTITDTCTTRLEDYPGLANVSFADPEVFSGDDRLCIRRADGFESGDTGWWSFTLP